MRTYLPEELDIELLLTSNLTVEISNFNKDKLLYIIGCITYLQLFRDDLRYGDYVPVNAEFLQKWAGIRNYNKYLKYLVNAGVIETTNSYKVDEHSRLYKFTAQYSGKFKAVELTDKDFVQSLKKKDNRKKDAIKQYANLWQWFSMGNLKIDRKRALANLHQVYPLKKMEISGENSGRVEEIKKEEDLSHKHYRMARIIQTIHEANAENLHFTVDLTAGRLHTILTNMNKGFRQFLTYGSEQLVSVDVKSCQPYLSLLLLQTSFYNFNMRGTPASHKVFLRCLFKDGDAETPFPDSFVISSISFYRQGFLSLFSTITSFLTSSTRLSPLIMLVKDIGKYPENTFFKDVSRYKHEILGGTFYEGLIAGYEEEYGIRLTRKEVKEQWSIVAFGKIRNPKHRLTPDFYKFFTKRYPTIEKLYSLLKAEKHSNLAWILQRIEAHIMLKVISKQITGRKPRVPLFSIHDSLVTTVSHLEFVKGVMEQELWKMVGEKPLLDVEYWGCVSSVEQLKAA